MQSIHTNPEILIALAILAGIISCGLIQVAFFTENKLFKRNGINILLWSFWIIALLVICYIGLLIKESRFNEISGLAPIGILIASFIASVSVMKSIAHNDFNNKANKENQDSKFFMDESIKGFENVFKLLEDRNNDRVTWIHAMNTLQTSLELESGISDQAHKKAYELQKDLIKMKLIKTLTQGNDLKSLPTSFFYGVPNWSDEEMTAETAYALSESKRTISYWDREFDVNPVPPLNSLDVTSIAIIYDFITDNPTPTSEEKLFASEEWVNRSGIAEGAVKYYKHQLYKIEQRRQERQEKLSSEN